MASTVDYQPLIDAMLEDIKHDEELQQQQHMVEDIRYDKELQKQQQQEVKKPLKKKRKTSKRLPMTVPIQPTPTTQDVIAATEVFQVGQDVYVKEIAFYFLQNHTIRVWSFKPPFSLDCFQPIHRNQVNLQTIHVHKLPWDSGTIAYSALYDIVHKITSTNVVYYYVQESMPNPLEGCAHINLTKMGCPHPSFLKYEGIEKMYCPIHQGLPGECAVQTVAKLSQWYKSICQEIPPAPTVVAPDTTENHPQKQLDETNNSSNNNNSSNQDDGEILLYGVL